LPIGWLLCLSWWISPLTAELVEPFTAPKQGSLVFLLSSQSCLSRRSVGESQPSPDRDGLAPKNEPHTPDKHLETRSSKRCQRRPVSVATRVHTPLPLIQSLNQVIPLLSMHRAGDLLRDLARQQIRPRRPPNAASRQQEQRLNVSCTVFQHLHSILYISSESLQRPACEAVRCDRSYMHQPGKLRAIHAALHLLTSRPQI
jgi:hypothetical protein